MFYAAESEVPVEVQAKIRVLVPLDSSIPYVLHVHHSKYMKYGVFSLMSDISTSYAQSKDALCSS